MKKCNKWLGIIIATLTISFLGLSGVTTLAEEQINTTQETIIGETIENPDTIMVFDDQTADPDLTAQTQLMPSDIQESSDSLAEDCVLTEDTDWAASDNGLAEMLEESNILQEVVDMIPEPGANDSEITDPSSIVDILDNTEAFAESDDSALDEYDISVCKTDQAAGGGVNSDDGDADQSAIGVCNTDGENNLTASAGGSTSTGQYETVSIQLEADKLNIVISGMTEEIKDTFLTQIEDQIRNALSNNQKSVLYCHSYRTRKKS